MSPAPRSSNNPVIFLGTAQRGDPRNPIAVGGTFIPGATRGPSIDWDSKIQEVQAQLSQNMPVAQPQTQHGQPVAQRPSPPLGMPMVGPKHPLYEQYKQGIPIQQDTPVSTPIWEPQVAEQPTIAPPAQQPTIDSTPTHEIIMEPAPRDDDEAPNWFKHFVVKLGQTKKEGERCAWVERFTKQCESRGGTVKTTRMGCPSYNPCCNHVDCTVDVSEWLAANPDPGTDGATPITQPEPDLIEKPKWETRLPPLIPTEVTEEEGPGESWSPGEIPLAVTGGPIEPISYEEEAPQPMVPVETETEGGEDDQEKKKGWLVAAALAVILLL